MKKWMSLLLCGLLILGLCIPAYAADESMQDELTRVTLAVKNTLPIGDKYQNFTGDVNDMGALRYWSLNWSNDDGSSLRILASDSGKILQYSAGTNQIWQPIAMGTYTPSFSKVSVTQAKAAAKKFLGMVLTKSESADLVEPETAAPISLSSADYSITARILLNGVASANYAHLQIDSATGDITYFSRDDSYEAYVNEVPKAVPAISAATAAGTLTGTIQLNLQYMLSDSGEAVLRYVPVHGDDYYVDAQTGDLKDLTKAWNDVNSNAAQSNDKAATTVAADEGASGGVGLSKAEQETIQKLKGVLSRDTLDGDVRKVTALGLGRYTLSNTDYSLDEATGDVTCTLYYTRKVSYSELKDVTSAAYQSGTYQQTKILQVNAKTGTLLQGWSYRPWYMKDGTMNRTTLQSAAESFLKFLYPDYAAKTALIDGEGGEFRYDRKENGYFYHDNYVNISIDPSDGSVSGFTSSWDDKLTFQSAEGTVSAAAAKNTYCAAFTAKLSYIAHPVSVNTSIPIWKTYAERCGYVAYRYVLGYTYETDSMILGVDAKTGKLLKQETKTPQAYTDISGSYAKKQIEALAGAGIGFGSSDKFLPAAKLTQKEMLVLLLNSCGYSFDVEQLGEEGALDALYSSAWNQGFIMRGSRSPDRTVTRMELVKAILDASPYSQAVKLTGIYMTSFTDAAKIPADRLGYAAIAQALGLVHGDQKGKFNPNAVVTRETAAAVLYNYMNR